MSCEMNHKHEEIDEHHEWEEAREKIDEFRRHHTIIPCSGPMGPQGPAGPQGPMGSLTYMLVSNTVEQNVLASGLLDLGDVVNSIGANITFAAPNNILLQPGNYYLIFNALVSNTTTLGLAGVTMFVNGAPIDATAIYYQTAEDAKLVVLQYSLTVTTPTTISIRNQSEVENTYFNPSLNVLQIG